MYESADCFTGTAAGTKQIIGRLQKSSYKIHQVAGVGVWGSPPTTKSGSRTGNYFSRGRTTPTRTGRPMVKSTAMIRQSSLTKLGVMINTAVNSKRNSKLHLSLFSYPVTKFVF